MQELDQYNGNVWTHILSLKREDAARLGYDNAYAWRNLLRSQAETIAENMKIPLTDLKWYAAYHDESYHPHVHMVVYSTGKEPYLTKQGIRNLKAAFAKQIFRHDFLQVYVEQTNQRNELTGRSRDILSDIIARINSGSYDDPVVTELLLKLSQQMQNHKGKKVYGYLPQAGRNLVNAVVDELAKNPLKFILFIDDLSFASNDDNFAALKAILEGSVGGRARNIAVYATSNRRHLIKETLTDRTGDDIHEADTRQELMSLSARFGLTVTFQRPEKARFAAILEELAKQHHIQMPMEELLVKAEAFAIRAGGRSPRVAKQFIEQCEAGVQK